MFRKFFVLGVVLAVLTITMGVVSAGYSANSTRVDHNVMTGAVGTTEINGSYAYLNYAGLNFQGHPGNIVRYCVTATVYSQGRALRTSHRCSTSWWGKAHWVYPLTGRDRVRVRRGHSHVQYHVNYSYLSQFSYQPFHHGSTSFSVGIG